MKARNYEISIVNSNRNMLKQWFKMLNGSFAIWCFLLLNVSLCQLYGQKKLVVVSSASIFDDMAKNIGGDKIEHYSIVPIGGDPHKYEATPDDAKLVGRADLILINGLTFEGWINEVIENSGTKARTVTITEGIKPIESAEHKNAVDPHAWMDAENGLVYIKNIKDALIAADAQNAAFYEKNYANYKGQLEALHLYIKQKIASIPEEQRILITSHDAFSYFGNKYGMTINAMMGVSTEADAQTSDLKRIIASIRDHNIKAIFVESTINPKLLQQIAKDQHVVIGGNLYADSIGEEGTEGGTYIGMLRHNADTIAKALTASGTTVVDHTKGGVNLWLYGFLILLMGLSWVMLYMNIKRVR
jgi:ABC-type Zn uptake system ZnuABC Zn-binding protein ZnuA